MPGYEYYSCTKCGVSTGMRNLDTEDINEGCEVNLSGLCDNCEKSK